MISQLLRRADVLLLVPPFAWQDRPALGVHILQALARREGLEAQVVYTNFLFTSYFDEGTHDTFAQMQYGLYLGERLFARAVLGGPPLGRDGGAGIAPTLDTLARAYERMGVQSTFTLPSILTVEAKIAGWLESFVPALAERAYPIVGCTSSFEQNLSSIAMLTAIKQRAPGTRTILGGANCEGEMAEAVAHLAPAVDHIFSGESEQTFVRLLRGETLPRIVEGAPCEDLEGLPELDYSDYFTQLRAVIPNAGVVRRDAMHLAYETSRGCWWGQKSHCTFCGLNGQGMAMREKSADRVIGELSRLMATHGVRRVAMTDNIMPHAYWKTLVPRLPRELPGARIMYEQKANLRLDQVEALVAGGVVEIQPGIEALSTSLLKRMAKGTTCAQNIALLRYARATGLLVQWNMLHGFPGDDAADYEETLALLPLIHHLHPPIAVCPVVIDRFSPYFTRPEQYGVSELRPFTFYRGVYPDDVPLGKLAYHFEGSYDCATRRDPELVKRLGEEVARWRRRYYGPERAELRVERAGAMYRLIDTRQERREIELDEAGAIAALVARPVRGAPREIYDAALARAVVIERDGKYVPLATATPELLHDLESRARVPVLQLAAG